VHAEHGREFDAGHQPAIGLPDIPEQTRYILSTRIRGRGWVAPDVSLVILMKQSAVTPWKVCPLRERAWGATDSP
jgi:hypothetical protein